MKLSKNRQINGKDDSLIYRQKQHNRRIEYGETYKRVWQIDNTVSMTDW